VNVTDQTQGVQVVNFNQGDRFLENHEADIPIMIPEGASSSYLNCRITDPERQILPHELSYDRQSNLHHIRFVPIRPGRHKVEVEYDGTPVEGSPFILNIEGNEGYKKVFASGSGLQGGEKNIIPYNEFLFHIFFRRCSHLFYLEGPVNSCLQETSSYLKQWARASGSSQPMTSLLIN